MKKLLLALIFVPSLSLATYIPVNGSTVVVQAANNNTTNIPVNASQTGTWTVQPGNSANTTAWLVQTSTASVSGSTIAVVNAVSTKLLVTPDSVALPANQSVNVAQINGVTPLMGNGTTGTGSHRVTLSSDNSAIASWGLGATGAAVPSGSHYVGGNGSGNLTGVTVCDNWTAINQTAGAQLITGASSKKTYICSINIVSATAQNIALVGGTGSVCATGTHAIAGGTTAATGWNLAANGGLTQGSGVGVIMQAGTAADNVCLLQSASGQVSGAISWTQY